MSATARENMRHTRINWQFVSVIIVGIGGALVIAANAHLVYVALTSQPDCVQHLKTQSTTGAFRAAQSSC